MRVIANIQMEKRNGDVLDISKTIEQLGPRKCSQLLGIHALSFAIRCRTLSEKERKKSALKLLEIYIPGIDQVLGQPGATHSQLKARADSFFLPLHGQNSCTAMSDARDCFFRGRKPQSLKKLPPTDATCSCTCFELTFRCHFGRQRINGTRQKKLEKLPTLVGASTDPPSLRLFQQLQLLRKHFWM